MQYWIKVSLQVKTKSEFLLRIEISNQHFKQALKQKIEFITGKVQFMILTICSLIVFPSRSIVLIF